jgi:SAM-dependent methyltransferase
VEQGILWENLRLMKNILNEGSSESYLSARQLATIDFMDDADLKDRFVLDIGCGYGWVEHNFLERGVTKIVGVEASDRDLETIRKNISNNRLELKVASASCLPFENNSFDTVVSWEVIEHIPRGEEELMFSEVIRVLKPGGVFYLSTPHRSFAANTLDPAWWLTGHRHYSRKQLEKFTSGTSLNVDLVSIKGGWWSLVNILNLYISKWVFRRRSFMQKFLFIKENAEYMRDDGFANIFIKFRKSM